MEIEIKARHEVSDVALTMANIVICVRGREVEVESHRWSGDRISGIQHSSDVKFHIIISLIERATSMCW